MDYFKPEMESKDILNISMLGLAHVGDGVYELMTRTKLCTEGYTQAKDLHRRTVELVNAVTQAKAAERLLPYLNDEEISVYKRGRNTHVHSVPAHAQISEYHAATGLEALFGYLYLLGQQERLNQLFESAWQED